MLYLAEGLKCGVKHDVGGKFSQHTLDVVEGHKCVHAVNGGSQAWPKFSDCKYPDSVNCTHLTRECEEQGGKNCCCTTKDGTALPRPPTPKATTSTTASITPPVPAKTTSNSTMKLTRL
uniref:Uncharacterized protein n=1 Tax=Globodera rostochiensis TaxID=31243 RepID=A0A914I2F7_GLORO